MVNVPKIQAALNGLVGFRQPFNPAYAIVDTNNQVSRSGLFANDNEFVKIDFLKDCQDYEGISDVDFNTFLANKQKESIAAVCNAVFYQPDFIDRGVMFRYALNKINTIDLPTGFIGYKIKIEDENNLAVNITRVILDFAGTGSIKLLLFNTSKLVPINTKDITITSDHQEVALNWVIDNTGGIYGGDWYIGYISNGLTVKPYARDYELSKIQKDYTNLEIRQILIPGHVTQDLFDLTKFQGFTDATGLNLDITVCNDYTDLAINNEFLFANAILYSLQIACMQTSIASTRSNRNERISADMIRKMLIEIEGADDGTLKKVGMKNKLYGSLAKIKAEITKLQEGYFGEDIMVETMC